MAFQPMLYKAGLSYTITVEAETLVTCVELRIMVGVKSTKNANEIVIEFVFGRYCKMIPQQTSRVYWKHLVLSHYVYLYAM